MTGFLKMQAVALSAAACLWLTGCVSTETTNNAGAGQPPGGSAAGNQQASRDRGTSPVSSGTTPDVETVTRRRDRP